MQFVIYLISIIYFLFLKMACLFNACISLNSATYICKSGRWIILAGTNMQEKIIEKHIPRIDTHWVHSNMFNYNFTIPLKHSNLTINQAFLMVLRICNEIYWSYWIIFIDYFIKIFFFMFDRITRYSVIIGMKCSFIAINFDGWSSISWECLLNYKKPSIPFGHFIMCFFF